MHVTSGMTLSSLTGATVVGAVLGVTAGPQCLTVVVDVPSPLSSIQSLFQTTANGERRRGCRRKGTRHRTPI